MIYGSMVHINVKNIKVGSKRLLLYLKHSFTTVYSCVVYTNYLNQLCINCKIKPYIFFRIHRFVFYLCLK